MTHSLDDDLIVHLYSEGFTLKEISESFGCHLSVIHWRLRKAGIILRPRGRRPKGTLAEGGQKKCSKCLKVKTVEEFHVSRQFADGLQSRCKECNKEHTLQRTYHITKAQYDAMIEFQHGKCSICGGSNQKCNETLAVDHDHDCCPNKYPCGKCNRGLLCGFCNTRLMCKPPSGYTKSLMTPAAWNYMMRWKSIHRGDVSNPWEQVSYGTAA